VWAAARGKPDQYPDVNQGEPGTWSFPARYFHVLIDWWASATVNPAELVQINCSRYVRAGISGFFRAGRRYC